MRVEGRTTDAIGKYLEFGVENNQEIAREDVERAVRRQASVRAEWLQKSAIAGSVPQIGMARHRIFVKDMSSPRRQQSKQLMRTFSMFKQPKASVQDDDVTV